MGISKFVSWFLVLFALLYTEDGFCEDNPRVTLHHGGEVEGSIMTSVERKKFYSFQGIPYAEPPVGELRFKPPSSKKSWGSIPLDATKERKPCPQIDVLSLKFSGDEDCLHLNVYTPKLETTGDKLPVMVYIHGGGFQFLSSETRVYGPHRYMDRNIVLVILNYRLGALGFLATGDDSSSGNYGLMDQSLALQWVKENIALFGGDSDQITLFGESAGGASVGYHLLSPMSKGLFHRAISQSGSVLAPWALDSNPLRLTKKFATALGCPTSSNAEIVECLREKSPKELIEAFGSDALLSNWFRPTVDGTFITKTPLESFASNEVENRVPFITGVNQNEGATFYAVLYKYIFPSASTLTEKMVMGLLEELLSIPEASYEKVKLIYDYYFSDVDPQDETEKMHAFIKLTSDGMFNVWQYETVRQAVRAGLPTYTYQFDHRPMLGIMDLLGEKRNLGVGHGTEVLLQFRVILNAFLPLHKNDQPVSDLINTLWTNFARNGKPTPELSKQIRLDWPLTTGDVLSIYHINSTVTLQEHDTTQDETLEFWKSVLFSLH